MDALFETWLTREDSNYEEQYFEPVVEELCQFRGGSTDTRMSKGKIFNAGYEVFIYAFFLGLYSDERTPLKGGTRKFRMPMSLWGRKSTEIGRESYTILQKYIFIALIAKSDVDLIALDKGDLDVEDVCKELMNTLNEYANTGFRIIANELKNNPTSFFENDGLLKFLNNFCIVG